jgi:DNA-binding transcriptional regulator LsrR (DeoR family)
MVNIPAVVDDQSIRDSMLRDSHYQAVRKLWHNLDIAIMSVSGLDEETSVFQSGIFSSAELASLRDRGGACATNFVILDASGAIVDDPISGRIVGLPFPDLKAVEHVIVVAAGGTKAHALRAALNSNVVTRLVTDVDCAEVLLAD